MTNIADSPDNPNTDGVPPPLPRPTATKHEPKQAAANAVPPVTSTASVTPVEAANVSSFSPKVIGVPALRS